MPMLILSAAGLSILDFTLIKRKWCMYTQVELECPCSVHCTLGLLSQRRRDCCDRGPTLYLHFRYTAGAFQIDLGKHSTGNVCLQT